MEPIESEKDIKMQKKEVSFQGYEETHPPTSYIETLMHLFKANVGTGCYAMGEAIKHVGIIVGPILVLIIGMICVHTQHMLVDCANFVKAQSNLNTHPDYADTVELCFLNSKNPKWHKLANFMKSTCNAVICITQLGFCGTYLLFIGRNVKDVLDYHRIEIEIHILVAIILIPVMLTALIRTLKYIAIFSAIANFFMIIGIILTLGYASQDLPPFTERPYFASWESLPLFFGTALFAFEGIALVLPLQNAMKKPKDFSRPLGVLNVGMTIVIILYLLVGTIGFWQYGDATEGSLTLNLPTEKIAGQVIKLMIATGVMLGYAIQFFVAVQVTFPSVSKKWKFANKHPVYAELIFRMMLVLVTFAVAELVPNLSLLLSLIGSVGCVLLCFVFPTLSELIIFNDKESGISAFRWTKDIIILVIAFLGFVFGSITSIMQIVKEIILALK